MRLFVEKIKEEGLTLEFSESHEAFSQLVELVDAGECTFLEPISGTLRAQKVGELVEVDGLVETVLRLGCGRCLQGFDLPVHSDFSVAFTPELPEVAQDDEDGLEVSADEMGLNLYHGDAIDLDAVIAEQVILAMPLHPLCSEDCRGLCFRCGADLNKGECGCEQRPFLNKFAALKDFKPGKKDGDE